MCMCSLNAGDTVAVLPCCHKYHAGCIHAWMTCHVTCPVCKIDVLSAHNNAHVNGDDDGSSVDDDNSVSFMYDAGEVVLSDDDDDEEERLSFMYSVDEIVVSDDDDDSVVVVDQS